ncbi:hypothetical protein DFH08DRAFT_686256 [Mycena albidolilacea]|uniref:Uncharacterized protein n=1 Tax=Mycena albidolilacea TaxID=1033008 RepID=A0AAD7AI20_9AGAR|nr:hypothetical protein DFH08DRAFT_686256 [Mycena albidolilacea]
MNGLISQLSRIWGVTIGGTVLQNELTARLPPAFLADHSKIKCGMHLLGPGSLQVLWNVLAGIGSLGLLVSFLMKHLLLHTSVNTN